MNPKVEWSEIKSRRFLVLRFDGHFSEEHAQNAIDKISSMTGASQDKLLMVWECTRMTGYDKGAREEWQKFIKALRPRLEAVHLVSDKMLIRIGALTVGMFAGININTWKHMNQLHAEL